MKRAVILFAEGYETVEALLVVDLLRRGGVEVTMASITEDEFVRSSHGVNVEMDAVLGEVDVLDYDAVILPGGMPGTINLGESDAVRKAILAMNDAGKIVAAVCAAPGVLGKYGLLEGKTACSFPQHEKNLIGATVVREPVVQIRRVWHSCHTHAALRIPSTEPIPSLFAQVLPQNSQNSQKLQAEDILPRNSQNTQIFLLRQSFLCVP